MSSTHAPKAFGILFVLVGIPWILWDASSTQGKIDQLDSDEARTAFCVKETVKLSIPSDEARPMCRCILREASERGIRTDHGGYDHAALKPVIEQCATANLSTATLTDN